MAAGDNRLLTVRRTQSSYAKRAKKTDEDRDSDSGACVIMSSLSVQNSNMKAAAVEDQPATKRGKKTPEASIEMPSEVFVEFCNKQGGDVLSIDEGKSTLFVPTSSTVEQLVQLANSFLKVSCTL